MPVRLGIVPLQGMLTAMALPGLHGNDRIHLRNGDQRPGLSLMARLSPGFPSTEHAAWSLPLRLGRIIRRRP